MTWTLPNILSVLRLVAAPFLAVVFLLFEPGAAAAWALVLFVAASLTDYVDGYLARAWNQQTRFGAMIDPIADKAMVMIALALILGLSEMAPWLILPVVVILFREVFVSGLREFLGADAGKLAVTKLAKWKTMAQMVAITVLLAGFAFETAATVLMPLGTALLWLAAALTLITGTDYFAKAMPYLRGPT